MTELAIVAVCFSLIIVSILIAFYWFTRAISGITKFLKEHIPLENKSRGIPLWKAAGEEMGLLFGNTTNNNDNRTSSTIFSPNYTITINGGDPNTEQRFRQIIEDTFRDIMAQAERVSFA